MEKKKYYKFTMISYLEQVISLKSQFKGNSFTIESNTKMKYY